MKDITPGFKGNSIFESVFGNEYVPTVYGKDEAVHPVRILKVVSGMDPGAPVDIIAALLWRIDGQSRNIQFLDDELKRVSALMELQPKEGKGGET